MAFSGRTARVREARKAERERRRDEARQQDTLASRAEEQRAREREEARRQETRQEHQALQASLDAARERREAALGSLRAAARTARRFQERLEARRADRLARVRDARRENDREEERVDARPSAERRQSAQRRPAERRAADRERRARREERQARPRGHGERDAPREPPDARRVAERTAARRARPGGDRRPAAERARAAARGKTARDAAAQRPAATVTERDAGPRETRRDARRGARVTIEGRQGRRTGASQARRWEQRAGARADGRRRAIRAARREQVRAAGLSEARRAEARDAGLEVRREPRAAAPEPPPRERPARVRDPLADRIPSGSLSGSLPWLQVRGSNLVNTAGDRIVLRGVSLLGLDGAPPDPERGFATGAGVTEETLDAVLEWGGTVLRIAINRNRVLGGSARWNRRDYLADLDAVIRHAAHRGAYTLLSLRRLAEERAFGTLAGAANSIAPQPDYRTIGMWRVLCERYADEPAVLFDLYAAPHAALVDDSRGLGADWDRWTLWVQMAVAALRRVHPRALCFVCGLDWGTDLSGFPVVGTGGDPIPNLVYAAHLVPARRSPWSAVQALARRHPVFITEWQGDDAHITWAEHTALALDAAGVGWTAAHWRGDAPLVRTVGRQQVRTGFGTVVRRALTLATSPRIPAQPGLLPGLSLYPEMR